jgi:hypothetical protein
LINQDPEYAGISVRDTELRLSQFADDTVLFLKSYSAIQHVFEDLLPLYEAATGMKVNITKTD